MTMYPMHTEAKPRNREELQQALQEIIDMQAPQRDPSNRKSARHQSSSNNGNSDPALANGVSNGSGTSGDLDDPGRNHWGAKTGAVAVPPAPSSASQGSWAEQAAAAARTGSTLTNPDGGPLIKAGGVPLKVSFRGVRRALRHHPSIWITALLVTALLVTAGVVGVLAAAKAEVNHRKSAAEGSANNVATAFSTQLQQLWAPLTALAAFIHDDPDFPRFHKRFDRRAEELLNSLPTRGAVSSLQGIPQGVVHNFYPLTEVDKTAMGHNIFTDPARRNASLETVERGVLTMQGPIKLKQGYLGLVARQPVFIDGTTPNETFGAPSLADNCSVCSDPENNRQFWGFVSCIINFESLRDGTEYRMKQLEAQGYYYRLTAPQPSGDDLEVDVTAPPPSDPVTAFVEVPNGRWQLEVSPHGGWVPDWRDPMLAVVVLISALIGLLVGGMLVSRRLQLWLIKQMKATNAALADEKQRMDVLLARQYNLISCVLQQEGVHRSQDSASSLQQKTLERIEDMRRKIGVCPHGTSGVDDLALQELLGEGSYGKVYKGIWRGSVVAVKSMVLPAKMSGAEKRERMAIMEAAISSTMQHPNIVQTYTYVIKPAGVSTPAVVLQDLSDTKGLVGGGSSHASSGGSFDLQETNSMVASFEVSLVLEYCDWGCLRDALDGGAFFGSDNALNYSAILDTAADVAKAMLHLHTYQVIHSDLKVRNVLLKSDGSSGRGVVAKVADFGLAITIESQDTHVSAFQGTMSHMAPEALLAGRISKAADVYSFGITMWELFTGGHAYYGVPRALLGHQVAVMGLRPTFPPFTPREYRQLAEQCWEADPDKRPSFSTILAKLQGLRQQQGTSATPALTPYTLRPHTAEGAEAAEAAAAAPAAAGGGGGGGQLPLDQQQKQQLGLGSQSGHSSYYVAAGPHSQSTYIGSWTVEGGSGASGGPPTSHAPRMQGSRRQGMVSRWGRKVGSLLAGSFQSSQLEPICDKPDDEAGTDTTTSTIGPEEQQGPYPSQHPWQPGASGEDEEMGLGVLDPPPAAAGGAAGGGGVAVEQQQQQPLPPEVVAEQAAAAAAAAPPSAAAIAAAAEARQAATAAAAGDAAAVNLGVGHTT